MYITCLDVEGVLVPEIWVAFAEASGIPELKRTTRDEPDYNKLMRWRLDTLKAHGLGIKEIQETISKIDPLPGAKDFLDELRSFTQVILLSGYLHRICNAAHGKAWSSDAFLQQSGNCRKRRDHRLQDACGKFQTNNRKGTAIHRI